MSEQGVVERRIVTVLFADLVGFTTLAERLDAEDVATIQDAYFSTTRETIQRYGGVLEKFIGDAAMAVFGAPRARDDDAERAVRAGLALVAAVEQLGARLGAEAGALQLRVGVNSGEVVHATSGPDAGRVTGDTVNSAARLQTAAEPSSVLLGELTALAVGESIELGEMMSLSLKGKADPVRAWRAVGVRPEPSRDAALGTLRAPILGRDDELARLEAIDHGRVTVVAPPGVGKSRLVAELAARLEAGGIHVVRARCRPHSASPYEVVGQLLLAAGARDRLGDALRSAGVDPARRDFVEREVGTLLDPAVTGAAAVRDVMAERETRFDAWAQALGALVTADRTALVVEDVHWAGGDLLAFLDHVVTDRRLVLCTARPSILESAPDWVASADALELRTLPPTDASELVHALVGDALPDGLVTAIADRSDGNPLFIEELLRTWISVGTLVGEGRQWRLALDPGAVTLPATVHAIYAAQLDDLPADARLVARRASIAGRRFADAALEPLELADRRDGLEVLRRRDFVAGPQPDPVSGDVYAYRHALLRDAGYASLARAERARLHVALARWLEQGAGEHADAVAESIGEHYAWALDSLPAIAGTDAPMDRRELAAAAARWLERGAEASLAVAAHEAAASLLQRAVELSDPDEPLDLARRRLRRGEILAETADLDIGIAEMEAAVDAYAAHLPDSAEAYGRAAYVLGIAYMQQIRFPEAEALTRQAIERLPDGVPARIRLMALHAWSVAAQGRDEGALDEANRAMALAEETDDAHLQLEVLDHRTATRDEIGSAEPESWREIERRALEVGQWRQAVIAGRISAIMIADTDPPAALPRLSAVTELAHAHGLTEQSGWCDLARCETLFVIGDWEAALVAGRRALELADRYAYTRLAYRTWMVLLPIAAASGDADLATPYAEWWGGARSSFPSKPSPYGLLLTEAARAWVARARGERPPLPGDVVDCMVPMSNPHFQAGIEAVTEAWIEHGRLDLARRVAARQHDPDETPLMAASMDLVAAWVARADGDHAAAADRADRALERARSIGAAWWERRAATALDG